MGDEIQQDQFEPADYDRFQERLEQETEVVRELFTRAAFDQRSRILGYELELCLVDADGLPSRVNTEVIETAGNPLFTVELARFNMEINGNPFAVSVDVLRQIQRDLEGLFAEAEAAARKHDARIAMFGVLPSLAREHLTPDGYMTALHRYNQLNSQLLTMRGKPVHLHLEGEDILDVEQADVMLEALATSLQIHMQVPLDEIAPSYNAALWSSMLVIAATANAPLVLGKRCWHESRIGIFKQAVDTRNPDEIRNHIVPRVHFGKRYVDSLLELFEDNFYYSPILPEVLDKPAADLHHLALHNGTIWRWVRPIVARNKAGDYHLRLELRVVPAGPTLIDTLANLAFYVGLTEGLKTRPDAELRQVPFETVEADFYRAARDGLGTQVHWIDGQLQPLAPLLLERAIPLAREGLKAIGIDDRDDWLGIVAARVEKGATGAQWILRHWKQHGDAARLVRDYLDRARHNRPVHEWEND